MSIMQGSEARLISEAIKQFSQDIKEGTYKIPTIDELKSYPIHSQHRQIKTLETFNILPKDATDAMRAELDLVGYLDIGDKVKKYV